MIDWLKPIEPTLKYRHRLDARVVYIDGESSSAVVVWMHEGVKRASMFRHESREWRNVPELSERDRDVLFAGWLGGGGGAEGESFTEWYRDNAAALAREFGE